MTDETMKPTPDDWLAVRRLSFHYPHPALAYRAIENTNASPAVREILKTYARQMGCDVEGAKE